MQTDRIGGTGLLLRGEGLASVGPGCWSAVSRRVTRQLDAGEVG